MDSTATAQRFRRGKLASVSVVALCTMASLAIAENAHGQTPATTTPTVPASGPAAPVVTAPPATSTATSQAGGGNAIATSPTPAASAPVGTIVVTGSRLATGFTSPTPVSTLTAQRAEQLQVTNAGDLLAEVPAFRASASPTTTGLGTSSIGSRFADLRGLGASHTLVLVDGERFIPSTTGGTVDLNNIPTLLIQRTEVVTGGASAAYGSGAVAGVINFILDTKLDGLKAMAQYGQSEYGDADDLLASIAGGTGFAQGRGHIVGAFEIEDSGGVGDCYNRPWCAKENQVVTNSTPGVNGLPAQILTNNIHTSTQTPGGLITSGPLKGTTFGANGNTSTPFTFGQLPSSLYMIGGTGAGQNAYLTGVDIKTPVTRYTGFTHASYDFNDSIQGFLEGSYGYVNGRNTGGYYRSPGNLTINASNPYLPATVRQQLAAAGATSFGYGREWTDLGLVTGDDTTKTYRVVAGLSGNFFGNWKWDGYYQYGHVDYSQIIGNDPIVNNFKNAVNSTVGPNGQIECAINVTNPNSGCSPLNPFGQGTVSAAAKAYAYGTSIQNISQDQHVIAANVHGDLFELPAGPVSVAMGLEHREEFASGSADALSQQTAFYAGNGGNFNGSIKVTEGYFETEIPVLKNLPLVKSLSINGAVRESDYSLSGLITSWKAGLVYEVNDWVMLRATRSRDIRAPNLNELYGPASLSTTTINDTVHHSQVVANIITSGNANLTPELGDTFTAGFVFTPRWGWLRGFKLSADYFDITLNNAISSLTAQNIVSECNLGNQTYCPFVIRNTAGTITQVNTPSLNLAQLKTNGVDIEAQYALPLERVYSALPGVMSFGVLATYVAHLKTITATGSLDIADETGCSPTSALLCVPDWTLDQTINYTVNRLSITAHGHYIDGGYYDTTLVGPQDPGYSPFLSNSINTNRIGSAFYLDLLTSYDLIRTDSTDMQFYAGVTNLTDKNPPLSPGRSNNVFFDPVGRSYKFGIRVKL